MMKLFSTALLASAVTVAVAQQDTVKTLELRDVKASPLRDSRLYLNEPTVEPVSNDLWNRMLFSAGAGALWMGGVLATNAYINGGKMPDKITSTPLVNAALALPVLGLTFYPGSTAYDNSTFGDWALITLGRWGTVNLGVMLGAVAAAVTTVAAVQTTR